MAAPTLTPTRSLGARPRAGRRLGSQEQKPSLDPLPGPAPSCTGIPSTGQMARPRQVGAFQIRRLACFRCVRMPSRSRRALHTYCIAGCVQCGGNRLVFWADRRAKRREQTGIDPLESSCTLHVACEPRQALFLAEGALSVLRLKYGTSIQKDRGRSLASLAGVGVRLVSTFALRLLRPLRGRR